MSDTWETDFRWRQVRVANFILADLLADRLQGHTTNAPADLAVIGVIHVEGGPEGSLTLIVWSASFEPAPNDGQRPQHPIPFFELEVRQ